MRNLSRGQRIILFASLLSLVGFLLTVLFKSSFTSLDANVNSWSASIHTSSLTVLATMIAYGFDTTSLLAASLVIAVYLFYRHYMKNALLLVGAMVGDVILLTVVKTLVHSARPSNGIIQETGFSFPSGHAMSATVFLGLLTYFAWQRWKSSNAKTLSTILSIVVALLVGFSRVYLNVHWLSDVLGGYLFGVFWFTFSILASQFLERAQRLTQAEKDDGI